VIGAGVPAGWTLELDPAMRRTGSGRVLIGGSPRRILRLTAAGARWLDGAAAGRPLSSPGEQQLARRLVDAGMAHPRPPAGAGPSPADVAVVIPVRDMTAGLVATLAAIGTAGGEGGVGEVIVVDDGSRDPDAVRAAAGTTDTTGRTVLRHDRSLGPAAARERGWRATSRPVIAFVDAEVVGDDDWLAQLLPHLGDEAVGAVAPRVRAVPGTAPAALAGYERARSALDLGARPATVRPGATVPYVPTTALVVRRAALESVGGFDGELRVGEDVDLAWRLHAHGWRVRYEPDIEVTHPSRRTLGAWLRQRVDYGTSAAPLVQRHGAAAAALVVPRWIGAAWVALALGHPVAAVGIGTGAVASLTAKTEGLDGREGARLAADIQLRAARHVADAVRRPWWPFALVLAAVCRRSRPALLAAVVVPAVVEHRAHRREIGLVRFGLLRLADDVAYGAGVWIGCGRERSARALLPSFRLSR
jgi:mycofactocin system glycosyltransferase